MTIVTKGKILRQDLELWDGVNKTAVRKDSTGGTVSGLVLGYEVDVLASYGNGENYTWQTINDCVRRIGSASVTLIFNPGTWTIDQNLTIGSNFTCRIPAGCVFNVSSGKTLTFSGPVIRDSSTWTSGSGTVTENGTRTFTGLVDLTGAVIQGTNALVFEGSTANAYETTFVITNPTADRTLTIPDADVDLSALPSLAGNNTWSGNQIFAGTITLSGKSLYAAEGAAVASASSCNIWLGDGNARHITGTTQIDDFATAPQAGASQLLIFDDVLILNQSANLNLNGGGADITTAAGDMAIVYADTTTQTDVFVIRASGKAVVTTIIAADIPLASIDQGRLKTTTNAGSLAVAATTANNITLTGGTYSWWTLSGNTGSLPTGGDQIGFTFGLDDTAAGIIGVFNPTTLSKTIYWDERYVQASPPYRYGPLFVTLMLDTLGNIIGSQVAPDPIWAYHGPTNITPQYERAGKKYRKRRLLNGMSLKQALLNPAVRRSFVEGSITPTDEEVEITLAYKDSDMAVIPHCFGTVPAGATVVLVRPGTPMMDKLYELLVEDHARTVRDLFLDDYLRVDNTTEIPLPGAPPILKCYIARWKLTP